MDIDERAYVVTPVAEVTDVDDRAIADCEAITEDEWQLERARTRHVALVSSVLGFFMMPTLGFVALLLADLTASGSAQLPASVGWLGGLYVPVTFIIVRANITQQRRSDDVVAALARRSAAAAQDANRGAAQRELQARRQEFESRLSNALEMAEDETEAIDVIERALAATLPHAAAELLLADNSHAHLRRMAASASGGDASGCTVTSPDHCPAARRAQTQLFNDAGQLDACPKLRGRAQPVDAAVCVPVSIMGRTVGVLHATARADHGTARSNPAFTTEQVQRLGTLANLAGSRIGLLRVMADTQLQANTDSLTGLLNRRSFEQLVTSRRVDIPTWTIAMADLDHFKRLNDTYGHDTGDRALRLFCDVLRGSVRSDDLLCRHGGEEFVIAFASCNTREANRALDEVRERLAAALTVAGLPRFTVSFGVVDATPQEALPALIARADAALFEAKRTGRDRIVVHYTSADQPTVPESRAVMG